MKNSLLLLGVALSYSSITAADCSAVSCSDVSISSMQITVSGSVWVQTSGNELNLSCTPNTGTHLWLDAGVSGGKNIYSALLAYKIAGKNVRFRIEENSNPCKILYIDAP